MAQAPILFAQSVDIEDRARADFYALMSRLYGAAPDAALLAAIASAEALPAAHAATDAVDLPRAWHDLIASSGAMDAEAAADEYQALFVGVGRSPVSLHGSAYAAAGSGNALVAVRASLQRLGLARRPGVNVYEDHLAAVCETMRVLITGAGVAQPFVLTRQREFFDAHIGPWADNCCDAIKANPVANYYRRVAQFTQTFMAIERDSFAIE